MKNLQFSQKSQYKVKAKKVMVSEEISTIEKKLSTLHLDNCLKNDLRTFQELVRPHSL
jgi:hypothetical protein